MRNSMTVKIMALLAVLALALAAQPAMADIIDSDYHSGGRSPNFTGGQYSSGYTVEFYTSKQYDGEDWIGYCVDPTQSWSKKTNYNIYTHDNIDDWSHPLSTSGTATDAAWLMEHFAPGFSWLADPSSVNYGDSSVRSTIDALQVAIWEAVMDPGGYDLSSGAFRLVNPGSASQAQDYLNQLAAHKAAHGGQAQLSGLYKFMVAQSNKKQDLIFGTRTAVPEPGTMFMVGSALAGLGFLRRRRRKSA